MHVDIFCWMLIIVSTKVFECFVYGLRKHHQLFTSVLKVDFPGPFQKDDTIRLNRVHCYTRMISISFEALPMTL